MNQQPDIGRTARTCAVHGAYEAKTFGRLPPTGCPRCLREHEALQAIREDESRRRECLAELRANSGLVGRQCEQTFDTFEASDPKQLSVLTAVREYAESCEPGHWAPLWLLGPCGTGKSHLLAAVVSHAIEHRLIGASWVTARGIIRSLRATWSSRERSEEDVLSDLTGRRILMIDEIGVGFGSDGELTQLLDVVDARYRRRLPTGIASNLNAPALNKALGDRLFDRLREHAQVLTTSWPSHRAR